MPDKITQHYVFTGWSTVTIYSEAEMAQALGVSRAELRSAITSGELCYHAHPTSNALREYQFNESAYRSNVARWQCLQSGGHRWQPKNNYKPGHTHWICLKCWAEKYD